MAAKIIFVVCAQALLIQSALCQCTSRAAVAADPGLIGPAALAGPYGLGAPYGIAAPALAAPYGIAAPYGLATPCGLAGPAMDFTPTSGGALPVSSGSALAPIGISVTSENVYEGALTVTGELPFVGTVGLEGVVPSAGAGAVNHACGNGINAMVSETTAFGPGIAAGAIAPGIAPAAAIAPGLAGPLGYRTGWAGRGCGCAI